MSHQLGAVLIGKAFGATYSGFMAKIAILVEKIYEDLELQYPRLRLREAGHVVDVIGPVAGEIYVGKHGYPQKAEKAAKDVRAGDYALVVIPGGTSPDHMRRNEHMVRFVRDAAAKKIPLAAICHGPWMLCSTDALKGRRCTSYMSIVDDVKNAGGKWVDEECVVDGPIITARTPDDLPAFMRAILQLVSEGKAEGTKGKPIAPAWVAER
jgi:protease I